MHARSGGGRRAATGFAVRGDCRVGEGHRRGAGGRRFNQAGKEGLGPGAEGRLKGDDIQRSENTTEGGLVGPEGVAQAKAAAPVGGEIGDPGGDGGLGGGAAEHRRDGGRE